MFAPLLPLLSPFLAAEAAIIITATVTSSFQRRNRPTSYSLPPSSSSPVSLRKSQKSGSQQCRSNPRQSARYYLLCGSFLSLRLRDSDQPPLLHAPHRICSWYLFVFVCKSRAGERGGSLATFAVVANFAAVQCSLATQRLQSLKGLSVRLSVRLHTGCRLPTLSRPSAGSIYLELDATRKL